jgi:hypothetical protein
MVARHIEQFTVSTSDDLDDLEACLNDRRIESALVEIPDGSSALLSAREFRTVVRLAREHGIELEFATEDPLRRELARIVGGRLAGDTPVEPDPLSEASTRRLDGGSDVSLPTVDTTAPRFRPWQTRSANLGTDMLEIEYEQSDPSFSFVVTPPSRTHAATSQTPTQTTRDPLHDVWEGYSPPDPLFHRSHATTRSTRRMASRAIAALMISASLLVTGVVAAIVVLPSATIRVTPATQQISAAISYGVAQAGHSFDIAIEPVPISTVLSYEAMIPATGTRTEPDGTAFGTILLTNTSTVEIVVPAGTIVSSDTGILFQTSEDVIVPGADPFGTLTIGSKTVQVTATTAGPSGNIGPEAIHGQLESGIYYSNREAFSGGTMREITVVSPEDIAVLRQRAEDNLNAQSSTALESRLAPDQTIIDGTRQREPIQYAFDLQAGDDAQVVRVQATLALSASTYRLGDIHERARDEVARRLAGNAESDTVLLPDTITISDPQPVTGANGMAFAVSAAAVTRSVIDQAALSDLRDALVGLDTEKALARIQQVKGVDGIDVQLERDWFGERMPRLQSRISVEVNDAAGVSTQATSSRP